MIKDLIHKIILSINDILNEMKQIEFKNISTILLNMLIVLIFICLLIGFFISLDFIIINILKLILKINLYQLLIKIVGK